MKRNDIRSPDKRRPVDWENTDRDQAHLGLGSTEGNERARDLEAHGPDAPVDLMHEALAERNAEHAGALQAKAERQHQRDIDPGDRNQTRIGRKLEIAEDFRKDAIKRAKETETKKDDKKARKLPDGIDELLTDHSATLENFVEGLEDMFD